MKAKSLKELFTNILTWIKRPTVTEATGTDAFFRTKNSSTNVTADFGVGAGGTNHGIWSGKLNKWMIHGDASKVYVNWVPIYAPKVLWSGSAVMNENQTISTTGASGYKLSESISSQGHGIILAFSAYSSNAAQNYNWLYFFVPKTHVANHSAAGINFVLSSEGFGTVGSKYLYISDTQIKGHAKNDDTGTANGITYKNSYWVLREVIGV